MGEILVGCWDCNVCNTRGVMGYSYECPSCGSGRPEHVEFYLPDDAPVIADAAQIAEAKAGPDWKCQYCNNWIPATLVQCNKCQGGDIRNSEKQRTQDYVSEAEIPRNSNTAAAISAQRKEDSVVNNSFTDSVREKPSKKESGLGGLPPMPFVAGFFLIFIIFCGYLLFRSTDTSVVVVGQSWTRTQAIQQYQALHEEGWSQPSGAYDVSTSQRIARYRQVLDHYETKYRTEYYEEQDGYTSESYRVQDGYDTETYTERVPHTERYVSGHTTRNLGNGRFERVPQYSTRTTYTTETRTRRTPRYVTRTRQVPRIVQRSRQVPYQDPIYRQEPVYATYYTYTINRWCDVDPRILRGQDRSPQWPSQELGNTNNQVGSYRLGQRSETYSIMIRTTEKNPSSYTVELDFNRWNQIENGQQMVARIRLNRVEKLLTLEEAANE